MNLYRIDAAENLGYDSYDSAVVAAKSEDAARLIHPGLNAWTGEKWDDTYQTWHESPADVKVTLIGTALPDVPAGVVLASFNAA